MIIFKGVLAFFEYFFLKLANFIYFLNFTYLVFYHWDKKQKESLWKWPFFYLVNLSTSWNFILQNTGLQVLLLHEWIKSLNFVNFRYNEVSMLLLIDSKKTGIELETSSNNLLPDLAEYVHGVVLSGSLNFEIRIVFFHYLLRYCSLLFDNEKKILKRKTIVKTKTTLKRRKTI